MKIMGINITPTFELFIMLNILYFQRFYLNLIGEII